MPDLLASLQGSDLGRLRILAEHWGVEFSAPDARVGLQRLVPLLLDRSTVQEVIEEMPDDVRTALVSLQQENGRMTWVRFTQKFGEVRTIGAARRDRERPDRNPLSPAEALWYLGFIARASFDTPDGPLEFAYIPDDLADLLPPVSSTGAFVYGRPASASEHVRESAARDAILDETCTLLAALRSGVPYPPGQIPEAFLKRLLEEAHLFQGDQLPKAAETRRLLEMSRAQAFAHLFRVWLHSPINDLKMVPGLDFPGVWENNPVRTRTVVLDFLSTVPGGQWWGMNAFVQAVKENNPDFQRPGGDYQSWYVKDAASGEFLKGIEAWDAVDGALLRYLISGPLFWLGWLDLGWGENLTEASAFRIAGWRNELLQGSQVSGLSEERDRIVLHSDGTFETSRLVPRTARYQAARFADWIPSDKAEPTSGEDRYVYRFSPSSLLRAAQQGLSVNHLMLILNAHAATIPPNLVKSFRRWEKNGREAVLGRISVLRMTSPIAAQALKKSPAGRFLGEFLNGTTVVIREGAEKYVMAALAELGYLSEMRDGLQETDAPAPNPAGGADTEE